MSRILCPLCLSMLILIQSLNQIVVQKRHLRNPLCSVLHLQMPAPHSTWPLWSSKNIAREGKQTQIKKQPHHQHKISLQLLDSHFLLVDCACSSFCLGPSLLQMSSFTLVQFLQCLRTQYIPLICLDQGSPSPYLKFLPSTCLSQHCVHFYKFPLNLLSAACMCIGVGLSTGEWEVTQGLHPWRHVTPLSRSHQLPIANCTGVQFHECLSHLGWKVWLIWYKHS